jgi:hypothetical protein
MKALDLEFVVESGCIDGCASFVAFTFQCYGVFLETREGFWPSTLAKAKAYSPLVRPAMANRQSTL